MPNAVLSDKQFDVFESKLCEHMEWALNQYTVFDYLEMMMTMGLVFRTDTLESPTSKNAR